AGHARRLARRGRLRAARRREDHGGRQARRRGAPRREARGARRDRHASPRRHGRARRDRAGPRGARAPRHDRVGNRGDDRTARGRRAPPRRYHRRRPLPRGNPCRGGSDCPGERRARSSDARPVGHDGASGRDGDAAGLRPGGADLRGRHQGGLRAMGTDRESDRRTRARAARNREEPDRRGFARARRQKWAGTPPARCLTIRMQHTPPEAVPPALSLSRTPPVRVIAVASGKGGVGKTNVVANLAVTLARRGTRVWVLDADVGLANLDVVYGVRRTHTLEAVLRGERRLADVVAEGPAGVRLIPAASGVAELTALTPAQQLRILDEVDALEGELDVLLIDVAAGISSNVLYFAAAATET